MSFEQVVGHTRETARLRRLLGSGRLGHAYLFLGEEGIGKFLVARCAAAARLCSVAADDACGSCRDCRLTASDRHPDLHLLDEADAPTLSIAQVRELIRESGKKPYSAPGRVFVVRDVHRMADEAQSALLKTLEEPPPSCLLILTTSRPQTLLGTIRSRCQEIRFRPLGEPETVTVLGREELPPEQVELLALISGGSPGKALALERGNYLALREPLLEVLAGTAGDPLGLAEAVYEELKKGEAGVRLRTQIVVEMWVTVLRDVLGASVGMAETGLWNRDLAERIRSVAATRGVDRWQEQVRVAREALAALAINASPDLVVSDLFLALA